MRKLLLLASVLASFAGSAFGANIDDRDAIINNPLGKGLQVGNPTGGNLGLGTVNSSVGFFLNGQAIAGGLAVPTGCVLGGNGSTLSVTTLGANLACTDGVLSTTGGNGTVTNVTGQTVNGFGVTVATGTSTPSISIDLTASGILKGVSGQAVPAVPGTDFLTPTGSGAGLTGLSYGQLPTIFANQVLGALTATQPGGLTLPTCSASNSALTWTLGVGFGCNAIATSGGSVVSVAGSSGNGMTVGVVNGTTTPVISIGTSINGIPKGNGTAFSVATPGTDYLAPNSSGAALTGLTYGQLPSLSANQLLGSLTATTPSGLSIPNCAATDDALIWTPGTGFGCSTIAVNPGTVTSVTGNNANGLTVSITNGSSTPGISVGTALGGLIKGTGTGFTTATAGTDYLAPTGNGSGLTGLSYGQLPALTANEILGSLSATQPGGLTIPSCSASSSALTWTSGIGFGCNTVEGGTGTVTNVSGSTANGFTVSIANPTTTPSVSVALTSPVPPTSGGLGTATAPTLGQVPVGTSGGLYTPGTLAAANLSNGVTGSGAVVLSSSPTLVTPVLGTPSSVTLTNATGLPVATGLSGTGTGVSGALQNATNASGGLLTYSGAFGTPTSLTLSNATGLPLTGLAGLGTGVPTALGNALNTANGLVGFSGALGTPTSGTLTNTTGLPVSTGLVGTGTGVTSALAGSVNTSGGLVTFNGSLGTPTSAILTNATGLPVSTGVAGLGTGVATALGDATNGTGGFTTYSGAFGIPASVTLTNATGLPLATGVTGTLQAAQTPAYTGDMTKSAGSLTTAVNSIGGKAVTLGGSFTTSGSYSTVFTIGGPTNLTLPSSGTVTAQGNTVTGSGSIVLSISPTLVTPALGTPTALSLTNATGLPLGTGVIGTLPNANIANPSINANGTICTLGSSCTVAAAAGTLTGTSLPSAVTSAPGLTTVAGGTFGTAAFANIGTSGATVPLNSTANTYSAKQTVAASTTSAAGLNIPPGATPTSPANGDIWTTSAGVYVRINGATVGPLSTGGGGSGATPTIGSGFGTSPTNPVETSTSTPFQITIGSGGTANSGVMSFTPSASHGYDCHPTDGSAVASIVVRSVPTSVSTATWTAYSATTGLPTAFGAGDVITATCTGF